MSLLFPRRPGRSGALLLRQAGTSLGFVLALVAAADSARGQAGEDALPHQMLYLPIELDPLDFGRAMPVSFVLHGIRLPDGRRGELYRLGFWAPVGRSHAAALHFDYVGLEKGNTFQYGGGRTTMQWASRMSLGSYRSLALDLTANLPTGVNTLHPLSAKAPSVQVRLRVSPLGGRRWRFWAGWWARRVSQPSASNRVDPQSWFPSGSGVDAFLHGRFGKHAWKIAFRQDLGGLPNTSWFQTTVEFHVVTDLALRIGGAIAVGPPESRPMDHLWLVGVVWRPTGRDGGAAPESPGRDSGAPD